MSKQRIVVVGNGMVGHKFIETLLAAPNAEDFEITTMSEESRLAYDRVHLSSVFGGASAKDLALTDREFYREHGVTYRLSDKVVRIDTQGKTLHTESGHQKSYDKLILATGSYPFIPPIPGADQAHCLVYRTIDDLGMIKASSEQSKIGVVVGGGLLGLEAANALKNLGLETHVVEFAPQLMAVQIDEMGGALLRRKIEELGLGVHTSKNTQKIVLNPDAAKTRYRMLFSDDSFLDTDMIVFSAGIRPQDELARQAEINVGERGGIEIDNFCRTSADDVYAIGECALWGKRVFGLVAPGYSMAKVAVSHISGDKSERFVGADMSTKLKLLGVDVASIGDAHAQAEGALSYNYHDGVGQTYKRIVVSSDGKKLLGAIMVGDAQDYGTFLQMYLNAMDLPAQAEALILPSLEGAGSVIGLESLPDTAQICSCNDVSKGAISAAVQQGCSDMTALKASTNAATGCGGCTDLVKQIMNIELAALGVEVNNHLCEHFDYSRQELADIVRIKKLDTFEQLLTTWGRGLGCDVCKPAVASILASYNNDYILKDEHVGLLDTNDKYLANMQKDGTYSVVPRVPGGEITPDKLIVLGEVAKYYGLYTKITGGQRVDLFGAQLHELPEIWQRLIDAGFETGHAYGKSMRTVKSCVGDSWCRYGVQDSVSMAITLEDRYKGLRSPHKIKLAVSGCTRECAEAQSKDAGIIATEKGWNLYVCGNGGMRPRHGDLFATDLDDETLIKYIDRFFMFYIRTAERLQRTSVWLENLEGGLAYLKQVVIEDKLGIAQELESEMTKVVGTYQCEWKTTLEDPKKLKRFQHFVNSNNTDPSLLYTRERGQQRPANALEKIELLAVD